MSRGPNLVLTGALIKLYVNNKLYKEVQQIGYSIDYGESPIYGIDSPFPQEISSTRISVSGSVSGLRLRYSGGIQAYNLKSLIDEVVAGSYVSIRIQDRSTGEDLLFVPAAKVTKQAYSMAAKGVVKLSFDFTGLIPLEPLDRA
jgi:hypothetical protein